MSVVIFVYGVQNNLGGEIMIPKIPSYRILDLLKAVDPKKKLLLLVLDLRKITRRNDNKK